MTKTKLENRLWAAIIDGLLLGFACEALNKVLLIPSVQLGQTELNGLALLGFIVPTLYHALMEGSAIGATIGKHVMKIRVVDINGQRLSYPAAFSRALARLIPLGWLLALLSEDQRPVHDYIGGSRVIDNEVHNGGPGVFVA